MRKFLASQVWFWHT